MEKANEQKVFLTRAMRGGDDRGRDSRTYPDDINSRRSNSARCPEERRASQRVGPGGGVWRSSGWHPSRQHILGMEKRTTLLGGSPPPPSSSRLSPREGKRRLAEALLVPVAATEKMVTPTILTSGAAHLA